MYCECEECRKQCKGTEAFAYYRNYDFVNIIYVCQDCLTKLVAYRELGYKEL